MQNGIGSLCQRLSWRLKFKCRDRVTQKWGNLVTEWKWISEALKLTRTSWWFTNLNTQSQGLNDVEEILVKLNSRSFKEGGVPCNDWTTFEAFWINNCCFFVFSYFVQITTVVASSENHDDQQGRRDLQHFLRFLSWNLISSSRFFFEVNSFPPRCQLVVRNRSWKKTLTEIFPILTSGLDSMTKTCRFLWTCSLCPPNWMFDKSIECLTGAMWVSSYDFLNEVIFSTAAVIWWWYFARWEDQEESTCVARSLSRYSRLCWSWSWSCSWCCCWYWC